MSEQDKSATKARGAEEWDFAGMAMNICQIVHDSPTNARAQAVIAEKLRHISKPFGSHNGWEAVFEENSACWYLCSKADGQPVVDYPFDDAHVPTVLANLYNLAAHNSATKPARGAECEKIAKDAALQLFHPFSHENTITNTQIIKSAIERALPRSNDEGEAGGEKYPSVFDTPEKQAKYEAARKEIRKGLQKLLDECDESQRLTSDDFNIVINAR